MKNCSVALLLILFSPSFSFAACQCFEEGITAPNGTIIGLGKYLYHKPNLVKSAYFPSRQDCDQALTEDSACSVSNDAIKSTGLSVDVCFASAPTPDLDGCQLTFQDGFLLKPLQEARRQAEGKIEISCGRGAFQIEAVATKAPGDISSYGLDFTFSDGSYASGFVEESHRKMRLPIPSRLEAAFKEALGIAAPVRPNPRSPYMTQWHCR